FIALNWMSAFVFPAYHDKIWSYLTPASILLTIYLPLLSVWYLFFCPVISIPIIDDNNTYYILTADVANHFPEVSPPLRTSILITG
ncbi:hypothetical protein PMAYCL1PPCAC_14050, partial [Pristionchus mayeri]